MQIPDFLTSLELWKTVVPAALTAIGTFVVTRAREKAEQKKLMEERDIQLKREREEREERERLNRLEREEREATRATTEFDKIIAANNAFQATIRSELDSAKTKIHDLETRLSMKDMEILSLNNTMRDLRQEIQSKETTISDLRTSVLQRDMQIDDLQRRIKDVEQRNNTNFGRGN